MNKPVIIVDYDPGWSDTFRELRERVASVFGDLVVVIEHVGSTSVPGCPAKPIIDIDVIIPSMKDLPQAITRLATLGYVHRGNLDVPEREAFATPPDTPPHHLYVCPSQSAEYQHHILFRDYLRSHPEEMQAYYTLKQRLALQFRHDREAYTQGKSEFVEMILQRAAQKT